MIQFHCGERNTTGTTANPGWCNVGSMRELRNVNESYS
jgi:hypothetical protein